MWEFTTEKTTENDSLPAAFIAALKAKHVKDGKAYSPNLERAKVVFDLMEAGQTVNMVVRNCGQKGFGEAMARIDIAAWRLYKQSQQTPIAKPPISGEGKAPRNFIIL